MGLVPGKESKDKEQAPKDNDSEGDGPQANSINEMQILEGHKDIVRLLIKIDEFRFLIKTLPCVRVFLIYLFVGWHRRQMIAK